MKICGEAGRFLCQMTASLAGVVLVIVESFLAIPKLSGRSSLQVFLRQVYFTGIEALPLLAAAALLAGYMAAYNIYALLAGDLDLTLTVFRSLLVQEGSVFIVSIFVLARSGSAIASELARMKQDGELKAIWRLGVDVPGFLIAPRVAATALSVAALTVYVQVLLVLGGIGLMALFHRWDYPLGMEKFLGGIDPGYSILNMFRSLIFGAAIGVVACSSGLRAEPGPTGIPNATCEAFVGGFATILFLQILFSAVD